MQPTLKIENNLPECTQNIAGVSFYFSRDNQTGEGLWFSRERIGNTPAHCAAPLGLQSNFSNMAREKGISELHNFNRFPAKPPEEEKGVRTRAPRRKSEPSLFGSFNPFATEEGLPNPFQLMEK